MTQEYIRTDVVSLDWILTIFTDCKVAGERRTALHTDLRRSRKYNHSDANYKIYDNHNTLVSELFFAQHMQIVTSTSTQKHRIAHKHFAPERTIIELRDKLDK